jgi:serine-type D-Ala-D-Ala carboxypeptidase
LNFETLFYILWVGTHVSMGDSKMFHDYLNSLVEERQLPGAVLHISLKKETKFFQSYGSFLDMNNRKQPINQNTMFDVASLTKIMVPLPSLLHLVSKNILNLDDFVQSYIPEFNHSEITIKHLLLHTAGLPADLPYQDRNEPRDVVTEILNIDLVYKPGSKTMYSDLGMILAGKIVERVVSQPLDAFAKENIFKPWGLYDTTYLLTGEKKPLAASTEWYQDHYIQGEVHDEKAFQLNGVSGSAGLFSTARDVATFGSHWLYPEQQDIIKPEWMKNAITHHQDNRGLGFEVWSGSGDLLSCGDKWPIGSFGHTGFTGTSIWIDPIHECTAVFLTNAVHYGRNTDIKKIRKKLHSLIHSSFIEELK